MTRFTEPQESVQWLYARGSQRRDDGRDARELGQFDIARHYEDESERLYDAANNFSNVLTRLEVLRDRLSEAEEQIAKLEAQPSHVLIDAAMGHPLSTGL